MWYIYSTEYYLAIRKNEIMPFAATWMDLEIIILGAVSQRKKILCDIIYIWNLKYDTNELIYETERHTDIENKLTVTKEGKGMTEG